MTGDKGTCLVGKYRHDVRPRLEFSDGETSLRSLLAMNYETGGDRNE